MGSPPPPPSASLPSSSRSRPTLPHASASAPASASPSPPTALLLPTIVLVLLLFGLPPPVLGYLDEGTPGEGNYGSKSSDAGVVFPPYAKGHVGYYGNPNLNPRLYPLNQGSPLSADHPRPRYGYSPDVNARQNCPRMVGPIQGKYYCGRKEHGYCDRRSGSCFCNNGYTGLDCAACRPTHHWNGTFCHPKIPCPNDCSGGGKCDFDTGICKCAPHRVNPASCDDPRCMDCSQPICSSHDPLCVQCNAESCFRCEQGFFVKLLPPLPPDPNATSSAGAGGAGAGAGGANGTAAKVKVRSECVPCATYDPRCSACDDVRCLVCVDTLMRSQRRSGRRRLDPALPFEDYEREVRRGREEGGREGGRERGSEGARE